MKRMKFIFIGLFLALFAFATLYTFSYYISQPVSFEDVNLEIAIRESLDKPDGHITISHLHGMTSFEAVGANIHSLEGIQYMKNLRTLNLEDNFVNDVRPLKDLVTLRELNLRNNEIISLEDSHFDSLTGLTNLQVLNLRHNVKRSTVNEQQYQQRLADISLLAALPSLESLNLRDNHINDPTPLADLTQLKMLDLSQNPIVNGDLSSLTDLHNLEELNLRETAVKELSFLSKMPNLTYLNLHSNSDIISVDPIKELTMLETLIIPNVPLTDDIDVISDLDQLQRLNIRNTGITDINVLESLMKKGALQDDVGRGIAASIDISLNPIPLEKEGDTDGYFPLRNYWDNITDRTPETLLPAKTETLYLNEYMASNSSTYRDVDGNYYDWIELYNPTDQPVSLAGYHLTDDLTDLTRYTFPDVTIEADSTLVVFASGEDMVDVARKIHTNFSLNRHGEPIILVGPDQTTIIDYFPPREIPQDMSFGRSNDDPEDYVYFDQPTPNTANLSVGSKSLLESPKASHPGGFYQSTFELTFDVPDSQTVYYTRDGSEPTDQSLVYQDPILMMETIPNNDVRLPRATTIRAISIDENNLHSDIVTNTYLVGKDVNHYFSFPVISISTDPDNFFDHQTGLYVNENYNQRGPEWERPVFVEVFEPNGVRSLNQNVGARIHGGFSRGFPQKSLRLYARSSYDEGSTMKYPFFGDLIAEESGMPIDEFHRILLRNSGNDWDGTMFRDAFIQSLVTNLGTQATQASRPSIVFINGSYWGIHNIRERQDEYYLASHYHLDPTEVTIVAGAPGYYDKGNSDGASSFHEMLEYIVQHDLSEPEHYSKIKQWIDLDNYLDYNITQIYIGNTDWPHNNVRMWRYTGENDGESQFKDGRWRWILFDTDFGFSRYDMHSTYKHDTISFLLEEDKAADPPEHAGNFLFRNLMKNDEFKDEFITRMQNHLNITFRRNRVSERIRDFKAMYQDEMPKQLSRWDEYGRQIDFWEYEVNRLTEFGLTRPYYLDRHLIKHFNLNDRFEVLIHPGEQQNGQIFIDDLALFEAGHELSQTRPWDGEYFKDYPIEISAKADDGYQFIGWELEDGTIDPRPTLTLSEDIHLKPIYDTDIPAFAQDYQEDIQRAKTLTIMITYIFTFVFSLLIIWSLKYFTNDTHHVKLNKLISLSIILTALILIPTLLNIWSSGIHVLSEQLSLPLLIFSLTVGGFIGTHLPHHTKEIKTFDA